MWPHVATLNIVPGTGPYQFRWIRISPGCWILVADSSPGRVEEAAGKGFACWPEAVGFVPGNNHDSQGLLWTNFLCQVFTMYQLENSHGTHFMEVRNMTFPWQMVDFKVTLSIYIDIYIYIDLLGVLRLCWRSVCRRPFFMKREQEDVDVVQTSAKRVHGMSALMCLGWTTGARALWIFSGFPIYLN